MIRGSHTPGIALGVSTGAEWLEGIVNDMGDAGVQTGVKPQPKNPGRTPSKTGQTPKEGDMHSCVKAALFVASMAVSGFAAAQGSLTMAPPPPGAKHWPVVKEG